METSLIYLKSLILQEKCQDCERHAMPVIFFLILVVANI